MLRILESRCCLRGLIITAAMAMVFTCRARAEEEKGPAGADPPKEEAKDPVPTPIDGLKEVVTESGLKYWDIKVGDGASPDPKSRVRVHYSGWLNDGKLFDSSVKRGRTSTFPLKGVIKGWTEGVGSMKVGGKRRLEVPPQLAYGEEGNELIPPNATLIFEVELFEILGPPQQTPVTGIEPVTTASGLKYWDIKVGDGPIPGPTSIVTVHYSGWLEDGTLFASSVQDGKPAMFNLTDIIKGWSEGVGSMKGGGKRRLEIPYQLAYGEEGAPPRIPPKTNLIFEVELLEIVAQIQGDE